MWMFMLILTSVLGWSCAFCPSAPPNSRLVTVRRMTSNSDVAGSFFNPVPRNDDDDDDDNKNKFEAAADDNDYGKMLSSNSKSMTPNNDLFDFDKSVNQLIQSRKAPISSTESTIDGKPTKGFGKSTVAENKNNNNKKKKKPYTAIGTPDKPVNDINNPERDDQGYMIYTDEETGEKNRVFEALVDYPCDFTMKIVGSNEGSFVNDIVHIVAETCEVEYANVEFSTKDKGKWISVTVEAPVQSAEMLYLLYEKVDLDPRVKFKF